jgi:hypothetical protein
MYIARQHYFSQKMFSMRSNNVFVGLHFGPLLEDFGQFLRRKPSGRPVVKAPEGDQIGRFFAYWAVT